MPSAESRLAILLQATDKTKPAFEQATKNALGFEKALDGLLKKAVAVGAGIAAAFAVKNVINTTREFGLAVDELGDSFGIAQDRAGELLYIGTVLGASTEEWTATLRNLSTRAVDSFTKIVEGTGDTESAFYRLGISVADSAGNVKSVPDLLGDIADRFAAMPDGTLKAAMAVELFGRRGLAMMDVLNQGRAGMERLGKEAEALGLTTGQLGSTAEDFARAQGRFNATLDAAKISLGSQLLPLLTRALEVMTRVGVIALPIMRMGLQGVGNALGFVIGKLKPLWDGLRIVWDILKSIDWPDIWARVKEFSINTWNWIYEKAKPALEKLQEIWKNVSAGLASVDWSELIERMKSGDWAGVASWIGDQLGKLGSYINEHAGEWAVAVADGLWKMTTRAWGLWQERVRPAIEGITDWIAARMTEMIESPSATHAILLAGALAFLLGQKVIPLVMRNSSLILAVGGLAAFIVGRLLDEWQKERKERFANDLAVALVDLLVFAVVWKVTGSPQLAAALTVLSDGLVRQLVNSWQNVTLQRELSIGLAAGLGAVIGGLFGGPGGAAIGFAIGIFVGDMIDRLVTAWQRGDIQRIGIAIANALIGALEWGINAFINAFGSLEPAIRRVLEWAGLWPSGYITLPRFEMPYRSGGGGGSAVPMAEGGFGIATGPTLFLAGERGPEPFWFGGSGGRGATPVTIQVTVTGNYIGDRRLARELAGDVAEEIMRRMRLQGQYVI